MNPEALRRHRAINTAQSILLLAVVGGLTGWIAWRIGGAFALGVTVVAVLGGFLGAGRLSPAMLLRAYRARPLGPDVAPELCEVARRLARRAELPAVPSLWYLPSDVMNAFAVGTPERSAVALSDGVLRRMDLREVAGVLAHEISHVRNRDTRLLGFADLSTRATSALAQFGLVLVVVTLPLQLLGLVTVSWPTVLLLLIAPIASTLAQLALSRTREFDADLEAARLLGDPRPLAAALRKMEVWNGGLGRRLGQLLPGRRLPEPCLLRTHPPTEERVARLLELGVRRSPPRVPWPARPSPSGLLSERPIRPRWHRTFTWF